MENDIARQWLDRLSATANDKNLTAHMALISRRISLLGMPGFESIGYDDWYRQCEYEFGNNILKGVRYFGLKPVVNTASRVMFKTFEQVEATDGTINAQGVEILLEKEDDGQWRMVQQRILPQAESLHAGLGAEQAQ